MRSFKVFVALSSLCCYLVAGQAPFNPSILQDTRDLPKTDGTFGFLYRTEDGIAHGAKGGSDGVIHGRFSYTDPTGLKVNYNYNAGSRVTPGYDYDAQPLSKPPRYEPQYQQSSPHQAAPYEPQYQQSAPQYQQSVPRTAPQSKYSRPLYSSQYREPLQSYPQRKTRPPSSRSNELYDDFSV